MFWMKNIETSTYGGNDPESSIASWGPMTSFSNDLMTPFYVDYNEYGQAVSIRVQHAGEPLTVTNTKRSIAINFQLNWGALVASGLEHAENENYTFQSNDTTLYGMCDIKYDITPHVDGHFTVHKSFNPIACGNDISAAIASARNDGEEISATTQQTFNVQPGGAIDGISVEYQINGKEAGSDDTVSAKSTQTFTFDRTESAATTDIDMDSFGESMPVGVVAATRTKRATHEDRLRACAGIAGGVGGALALAWGFLFPPLGIALGTASGITALSCGAAADNAGR